MPSERNYCLFLFSTKESNGCPKKDNMYYMPVQAFFPERTRVSEGNVFTKQIPAHNALTCLRCIGVTSYAGQHNYFAIIEYQAVPTNAQLCMEIRYSHCWVPFLQGTACKPYYRHSHEKLI